MSGKEGSKRWKQRRCEARWMLLLELVLPPLPLLPKREREKASERLRRETLRKKSSALCTIKSDILSVCREWTVKRQLQS